MGIKGFKKLFAAHRIITYKELKGKRIALDISPMVYRAALGMKSTHSLTNKNGDSTVYLNTVLANLLKFIKAGAKLIACFDYNPRTTPGWYHNTAKLGEFLERRKKKTRAINELNEIKARIATADSDDIPMFSDDEDDDKNEKWIDILNSKEKQAFSVTETMFNNIKLMLNLMNIPWIEAPAGFEADCLAARLTHPSVNLADIVFSLDTDPLVFGAKEYIRVVPGEKKLSYYEHKKILDDNKITHEQLIKIGIVLGCDFYNDKENKLFYRIGPRRVIQKIKSGDLDEAFENEEVKVALNHFRSVPDIDVSMIHSYGSMPLGDNAKINQLKDWLVIEQNFNRERISKMLTI